MSVNETSKNRQNSILLLLPQLPYPPEQGTSLRNLNILRGLSQTHNLKVSVLTFVGPKSPQKIPKHVAPIQQLLLAPLPQRSMQDRIRWQITTGMPDLAQRLRSPEFESSLQHLLMESTASNQPFEIVQIEGLELAHTLPVIREFCPQSKIVFDNHNAESQLQWRTYMADRKNPSRWLGALYSYFQSGRLAKYEQQSCRNADWVTVVSPEDRRYINQLAPNVRTTVIPNCIDIQEYATERESITPNYDLVFIGKMDYRPNVDAVLWFGHQIWPRILERRPDTTWAIVGKYPHRRIERLKQLKGVTITGRVERIQPYLYGAKVSVLPFRIGGGTRLKFIEAMAMGKATVSTSLGVEGFEVVAGRELLVADTALDFSEAVLKLLDNPEERSRLGSNARRRAADYDWRHVIPKFFRVYDELLGR